MDSRQHGFSLIELSIVLVILALIVGAVGAGTQLLEASRIRAITAETADLQNQVNLFRSKFSTLPGDFREAGALWGNDCANSTSGSDTCSGNGNGLTLENDIASTTSESLRAWQHISRANISTYLLTGLPASGCSAENCASININIPGSKWPNAGYSLYSGSDDSIKLALFLGAETSDSWNSTAVLDPVQISSIDNKTDDGNPVTGNIRGTSIPGRSGGDYASCVNDSVSGAEVYRVGNSGTAYCTPVFILVSR